MNLKKILKKLKRKTRNINSIREINYETVKTLKRNNPNMVIIDVRSPQEYAENRINTAINIPEYDIDSRINKILPNKLTPIILYCQSGTRSQKAYKILEGQGYTNLYNLKGGLENI